MGVQRFVDLFADLGIPATFYCVAEDLELPGNLARLRALVDAGHEVGNHTWHHRYDLTRLDPDARRAEVQRGRELLEAAAGAPVVGFRSPGYNTDAELQRDIAATGHTYDSSVFPCAPYYLAKAGVLGWMRVRGRTSRSILGTPRVLAAPRGPYTAATAEPHRRGAGLRQFPISVAAGIPLIGTAFTALGRLGSLAAATVGLRLQRHLTLEFHAADLLALHDDALDPALAMQPDLKVAVDTKRRIFHAVLDRIRRERTFVRLDRWVAS